jgi:hypothetical protein
MVVVICGTSEIVRGGQWLPVETSTATLTSTLPVRLRPEQIWDGLLRKAENPVPFIPAITGCTVLERHPDGSLTREIVIGERDRQRERVTFEPMRRIVFEQLTDPNLSAIVNEIGQDGSGPSLTVSVVVSVAGMAREDREPGYLAGLRDYFAGTLRDIVDTLHQTAA